MKQRPGCPDCGEYHAPYKPWHSPTDRESNAFDVWLGSLESDVVAITQRGVVMTIDQLDRYARIIRRASDDLHRRIKKGGAE